jgi:hypothetical protein
VTNIQTQKKAKRNKNFEIKKGKEKRIAWTLHRGRWHGTLSCVYCLSLSFSSFGCQETKENVPPLPPLVYLRTSPFFFFFFLRVFSNESIRFPPPFFFFLASSYWRNRNDIIKQPASTILYSTPYESPEENPAKSFMLSPFSKTFFPSVLVSLSQAAGCSARGGAEPRRI